MTTHISKSEAETYRLAEEFAGTLRGGDVVALVGDLGSGKTTFVRGVAKALGSRVRVKSPTFTVMNEYPADHPEIKSIVHIDLYRFQSSNDIEALALEDYIRHDAVVFIEWPNVVERSSLPVTREVRFAHVDEAGRKITFDYDDEKTTPTDPAGADAS